MAQAQIGQRRDTRLDEARLDVFAISYEKADESMAPIFEQVENAEEEFESLVAEFYKGHMSDFTVKERFEDWELAEPDTAEK